MKDNNIEILKKEIKEVIEKYELPFNIEELNIKIDIMDKKIKNNYYNNIKKDEKDIIEKEKIKFLKPFIDISDFYKDDYFIKDIKLAFDKYIKNKVE